MMHIQTPHDVQPAQYSEALLIARQSCARIFARGGTPSDALQAFGLGPCTEEAKDGWPRTVDRIAAAICAKAQKRAA